MGCTPRVSGLAAVARVSTALLCVWFAPSLVQAQQRLAPVARVLSVQGDVEVQLAGQSEWSKVKLNDAYAPGDNVRVLARSRAEIMLLDQSVLRIDENTSVEIQKPKGTRTGVIGLLRGAVHFFSRGPQTLDVQTPFTDAGVRGTEFLVAVEAERTLLTVFEGTVVAENASGSLMLTDGQSAMAERGKAPVLRVVARPRDAVTWTLHYPPVLDVSPGAPPVESDPRFLVQRAQQSLFVGRADQAAGDIDRALAAKPGDADALALQTTIAVVQNDKDRALQSARKAVEAAPDSATAHVALSYAQQARFDLGGARSSVERAVQLDPRNAVAWARLSELHASFGELDDAFAAAQKAVELRPDLSRTQTVLGYASLMKVDVDGARAAFEKAITLDSSDPLPRLGRGLAAIRAGSLGEGGRDIEAAAGLDPSGSLIRSYLGKTYYEEKRTGLDEREYAMAQQLDPNDPTPWFYDAIAKQTTNRPVAALADLERAIELNGNRAVYRSKLLLDADEASRSASLARIYSDLGFQQLALVEGWKSVNADPTSYSSHRFLADSYSVMPRHEIARVSELLQSQLLQPLNMTPIQPRLAESNLGLISAGGPSALSFNEFNPLFNRDGFSGQLTLSGGNHTTLGAEGSVAGIYRNASFSVGLTHFETDGFRPNAWQKDDIANAFVQVELDHKTSLQAEYRYRHSQSGDIRQLFYSDQYLPTQQTDRPWHTVRLGGRHAFGPASIVIASLAYQDVMNHVFAKDSVTEAKQPQRAGVAEAQYLGRWESFSLRGGAGYVVIDSTYWQQSARPSTTTGATTIVTNTRPADGRHGNVYAYADLPLPHGVVVTAGASFDAAKRTLEAEMTKEQINPKLGVTWTPVNGTTVRAAVFRALKRTLVTDQTIEPTQVAGFNQFYDDPDLTSSWRYGAAVDQKLSRSMFAGAELAKRDLSFPLIDSSNPGALTKVNLDWTEYLGRAYLFWTPHPWLGTSAEYSFERYERAQFGAGIRELETHRVPLAVKFFHPIGFSASLGATFWNQRGRFENLFNGALSYDRNYFWTVDASVSYRLPERYGFVTAGATNLFDRRFNYFEVDEKNPRIVPARMLYARLTVALP